VDEVVDEAVAGGPDKGIEEDVERLADEGVDEADSTELSSLSSDYCVAQAQLLSYTHQPTGTDMLAELLIKLSSMLPSNLLRRS
jgi:hypothetical protein